MTSLTAYLPHDRLQALAHGATLPDRTTGAALFADISGFTPLTEALREALGPRRGAEALTKHLDAVYPALIAEVENYGGSVIGFAGDAITCWFADGPTPAAPRAVAAAFALQTAMQAFKALALPNGTTTPLSVKVAVATGPVRRFVVGDPALRYIDALAGATVTRTATAEHIAQKGEILVDEATTQALGTAWALGEWRTAATGERFAVVTQFTVNLEPWVGPPADFPLTAPQFMAALRPYLLPAIYEREQSGSGSFLTEFRPCVAVFVRFVGIDYDADAAQPQLDAFLRQAQAIAARYGGSVLDVTIGDKGSYVYIALGALSAHEDDPRRAVKLALALRTAAATLGFLAPLQIGLTHGTLRAGAYGGPTRKTYSALGDEVNLAARLMQAAAPGEILLSRGVQKLVAQAFICEPRPALPLKGKAEPLPVFAVTGVRQERALRLPEPPYALPMVGRAAELQIINAQLDLTLHGQSQIIGLIAEAGLGKSRLVAEVIRLAHKKGFVGYGGACQSDAVQTPYQVWKAIWQAFFDVDPAAPLRKQLRHLEAEMADRAPARGPALPLLGPVLDLEIPDNTFTQTLEPQYRPSALRALLEDCLRAAAQVEPVLLVLEDLHWIDALAHDLLEALARGLRDCRVCFVLAYRPPQLARLTTPRLEALPNFTRLVLPELNPAEAEQVIHAKLAQLYPARRGAVPAALVEQLMARAQGNPFYLEELLNFLHDRGLDPRDPPALEKIELPDSLHTLILSRLDQLSEHAKTTLRVASIIGRLFRADWLTGYYPALGVGPAVKNDLALLAALDLTPLDTPEPELAYLFKHIVTHEVTYESLPFVTRARLHEQLAQYIETADPTFPTARRLDLLAHHYGRSTNIAKQREYFQQAAQAALAVSAFHTAVDYLTRLLELLPPGESEHAARALQLAEAHYRLSDFPAARRTLEQAQRAAPTAAARVAALALLGEMTSGTGEYTAAQAILAEAVPLARANPDPLTLCRALYALGDVNWRLGHWAAAQTALQESLALARRVGDVTRELFALNRLGVVLEVQGDLAAGERCYAEVHTRAVAVGNRERAMVALNNLGVVADEREEVAVAQHYFQQALALAREIGAQQNMALYLSNLAAANFKLGQFTAARAAAREGLGLALRLGVQPWAVAAVTNFAALAHAAGQPTQAVALYGLARRQPAWSSDDQRDLEATLATWALDPALVAAGLAEGAALDWDATVQALLQE